MLDSFGVMVAIPVSDRVPVVGFDAPDRDRRRDHVFCKISCQALPARGDLPFLDMGDKPFWVGPPAGVDVSVDSGVCYVFSKHSEEVILPFSVEQIVGKVVHREPVVLGVGAACGCEDVQVGVVVAWSARGLEDDDGAHV